MTITKQNKIIAEFMNIQLYKTWEEVQAVPINTLDNWMYDHQADYNKNWNRLMPVIEKISKHQLIDGESHVDCCYPITFNMPHENGGVMVRFKGFGVHTAPTLIEATFNAVVEVIQHYNENKS